MSPLTTITLPEGIAERPICPTCTSKMRLVWIAADKKDHDRHTFECPGCNSDIDILLVRDAL